MLGLPWVFPRTQIIVSSSVVAAWLEGCQIFSEGFPVEGKKSLACATRQACNFRGKCFLWAVQCSGSAVFVTCIAINLRAATICLHCSNHCTIVTILPYKQTFLWTAHGCRWNERWYCWLVICRKKTLFFFFFVTGWCHFLPAAGE